MLAQYTASSWLTRKTTTTFRPKVYLQYGHYISWSNAAPYTTSRDRIVMLVEALQDLGMEVVEELVTGPEVYNHTVHVASADFEVLYTVDNIRKLGKRGAKEDSQRQPIVRTVQNKYSVLFGMTFETTQTENKVNDDFGSDMFMSSMPSPVKQVQASASTSPDSVVTPVSTADAPKPPAADTGGFGGFAFSMDEDF